MAGSIISYPTNGASVWTNFVTIQTRAMRGFMNMTVDSMADGASAPTVQSGSHIEIGSSIYQFSSNEDISTGWSAITSSTIAYLKVVPVGSTCTIEAAATAPTWSHAKQGWYSGDDRYFMQLFKDASDEYDQRALITGHLTGTPTNIMVGVGANGDRILRFASDASIMWDESEDEFIFDKTLQFKSEDGTALKTKVLEIGEWNMDSSLYPASTTVPHGIASSASIVSVQVIIYNDGGTYAVPLNFQSEGGSTTSGFWCVTGTVCTIYRRTGQFFDNEGYDATASTMANRGHIYITYKA